MNGPVPTIPTKLKNKITLILSQMDGLAMIILMELLNKLLRNLNGPAVNILMDRDPNGLQTDILIKMSKSRKYLRKL